MKKVLVVSDSHGLEEPLSALRERHPDVDIFIHCGDSELPKNDRVLEGYVTVGGNCDFNPGYPNEELIEAEGIKIFVTHGHLYSVKSTLMNIQYRAHELGANIACFGHSHLLGAEMSGGILFLNPGSIRLPRGRKERTYLILGIEGANVELSVYDYEDGELPDLHRVFQLEL